MKHHPPPASLSPRPGAVALLLAAGLAAQNRLLVPQQFAQIQDAIAAASPGDVIEVTTPTGRFQPIVIDRPLTIFGRAFEHTVPVVVSAGGPAIDVRVASGETVYLAALDAQQATAWPAPDALVRVRGGRLVLDDCRLSGGESIGGGSAALGAEDADVVMLRSRVAGRGGSVAIRATRSHLAGAHVRAFGSGAGAPVCAGIELIASTLHGTDFEMLGGETTRAPGGHGLQMDAASRCWLTDSFLRGGIGSVGGSGLVNLGAVPARFERCTASGGFHAQGGGTAPPTVGPVDLQARLLAAYQRSGPYRTFPAFQLGSASGWSLRAAAGTPLAVLWSDRLSGSLQLPFLAQPTWFPPVGGGFLAAAAAGSHEVSFVIRVPAEPLLIGRSLWLHGVGGAALPLLAAPPVGGIIRP